MENYAKALFFAQYLEFEPTQMTGNSQGFLLPVTYSDCVKHGLENRWLELRDIKDCTQGEMKTFSSLAEGLRIKYLQSIGVITAFLYLDGEDVQVMSIENIVEAKWAIILPLTISGHENDM